VPAGAGVWDALENGSAKVKIHSDAQCCTAEAMVTLICTCFSVKSVHFGDSECNAHRAAAENHESSPPSHGRPG
jgi:hypothetical protein